MKRPNSPEDAKMVAVEKKIAAIQQRAKRTYEKGLTPTYINPEQMSFSCSMQGEILLMQTFAMLAAADALLEEVNGA